VGNRIYANIKIKKTMNSIPYPEQKTGEKTFSNLPLVSVIIPCYNHAKYLTDAIKCIERQNYPNIEKVVVDDGSTDNMRAVAAEFSNIKYIYQENQGLSAARNTGIKNSSGEFLLFLDADDLLFDYTINYNVEQLLKNPDVAFVSGAHEVRTMDNIVLGKKEEIVESDHYVKLLNSNYIGMHGTVLYRRFVFDDFVFDTTLKACEDYDMYLKVARKFPIMHHTRKLAIYRMHKSNMSGNIQLMLKTVLSVMSRQKELLKSKEEKKAYMKGIKGYEKYYGMLIYNQLLIHKDMASQEQLDLLKKHAPFYYFRLKAELLLFKTFNRPLIKKIIPSFISRTLYRHKVYKTYIPSVGKIREGDFKRTRPFSTCFGFDRGGPIDRYYIENFLHDERGIIKGKVLEIGDNEYTLQYGTEKVLQSDILHVSSDNPKATIVGDLSNIPNVPDDTFDCIILTQTLHLIYDYKSAIQTCYRILKPGGSLLLTVPGITPIDHGEWKNIWYWSFTGFSIKKLLAEVFHQDKLDIKTFGNVYTASAFLYGMGLAEIKQQDLDFNDPHFQVIVTARAVK
jgi:glycosyltransferase involved in cell wall biosynthesis